jgi:DNA adenine methylase
MKNPLIKPWLKWAGGKRQLLSEIRKNLPAGIENYTYFEPFCGAGAVFFDLQPEKAVINDANSQLMLTYTVIKDSVEPLIDLLKQYSLKNTEEYYYQVRSLDRDAATFSALPNIEKAARLIFLNKTCFNGLYRVNSKGLFNVPYGRYKNPVICEEHTLRAVSEYLNKNYISLLNMDFEQAVTDADKHAFVYFDPPYHSPDKSNFTAYQPLRFDEAEQERLQRVYRKLTEHGVKCLLSNSDTYFIRKLYSDSTCKILTVRAKRAINSNAADRGFVNEVLIKNW